MIRLFSKIFPSSGTVGFSVTFREGERSDFLIMVMRISVNTRRAAFLFMSLRLNRSDFPVIAGPSQTLYKLSATFQSVSREV